MVTVEVVIRSNFVTVGPFDTQRKAMEWICELIASNPNEKAIIAVNASRDARIRVYTEVDEDEPNAPKLDVDFTSRPLHI